MGRTSETWVPEPIGERWTIAPAPDLTAFGYPHEAGATPGNGANEPNDHTIFEDADGRWHCWACVRRTAVGRLFCHWESASLQASPWRLTNHLIRADRVAGESRVDWRRQEFLQSPFVVTTPTRFWMFYGGYDTGFGLDGRPTADYSLQEKQICLMTSGDGRRWKRARNADGLSRVFVGPGAARDPCIVRLRGLWYAYYSGHHEGDRNQAGIYMRTSENLLDWSPWRIAQYDTRRRDGDRPLHLESPYVVERGRRFYLFRTHGAEPGTHVYVSDDPLDFGGTGGVELDRHRVAHFPEVIAPEIIVDGHGQAYLSNIAGPHGYAISLQRLRWRRLPGPA